MVRTPLAIPATVTFGLGLLCLAMAVYSSAMMAYVVFFQRHTDHAIEMLLACFMYWWTGIALLVAGVAFWRGLLRTGLIATGIATGIAVLTVGGFIAVLELIY